MESKKKMKKFFLSEEQKKNFCKMIVDKNFDSKQVFFSNEYKLIWELTFVKGFNKIITNNNGTIKKREFDAYNFIKKI